MSPDNGALEGKAVTTVEGLGTIEHRARAFEQLVTVMRSHLL